MSAPTAVPTRRRSRLWTALVTLCCIALAAAAIRASEPDDKFQVIRGSLGAPSELNGGTVTVDRLRVGHALSEDGLDSARTAGMFVVVRVTAAAPGQRAIEVSESQVASEDRIYHPYFGLASVHAQPGFRSAADLVFEVDPVRIADLTLELWQTEVFVGYPQHVRVPLGITAANAGTFANTARTATVSVSRFDTTSTL